MRTVKKKKQIETVEISDAFTLVPGSGYIDMYTPVSINSNNRAVAISSGDFLGITVPSDIGSVVFTGNVYDLGGNVPPTGIYLIWRDGRLSWVDQLLYSDTIAYRVYNNQIIKEFNMSYATGKSDAADYKEYLGESIANWAAAPVIGCPIKLVSGSPSPATAADEVIYGVVYSSTTVTDPGGGADTYDITILVSEADFSHTHGLAATKYGKPLFVQVYTYSGTTTFTDIWDTELPNSGYSHPLFLINDADTLHYNGIVRPAAI
jgi:hypothetical protein